MIKDRLLKTLVIAGAALFINLINIPLVFDSLNVIFGGVLVYFVLEAFGFPYALIVATGIAVQRIALYSEPAGGLITIIELLGVQLIRILTRQQLIISGWIFWTFIGWILSLSIITHISTMDIITALTITLKEAVNGIINITLGSVIHTLYIYYINKKKKLSYSNILFVFLAGASIIPLFFKTLYQVDSEERFMLEKVKEDISLISESVQDSIQNWLSIHINAVRELANRLVIWGPDSVEQLQVETEAIQRSFDQFHACYIANKNARAITFYPDINPEGMYMRGTIFSYRDYFKEIKKTLKPYITEVFIAKFALQPVVGIAVPAVKEGEFIGYAYCGLKLDRLKNLIEEFSLKKGVYITLVDKKGRIISSNFPGIKPMDKFMGVNPIKQIGDVLLVSKDNKNRQDGITLENYKDIYFHKHKVLNLNGNSNWIIVMEISIVPYIKSMFSKINFNFLLIHIFTLMVFLISRILTSISVEPIKKLSHYVIKISREIEKTQKADVPTFNIVEISMLSEAFRTLTLKVITYMEELKKMAYFDYLTGLPNRILLKNRIDNAIKLAQKNKLKLAVLFIDIDHFKTINDTLGHDFGDMLLKLIANRLSNIFRESDTVARFGGDEFVAVTSVKDINEVIKVAERILKLFESPFYIQKQEIFISASIGIAIYPDNGKTSTELIKNADMAMYKAKEEGKNNFALFSPELNKKAIEILTLKNKLHKAIERREFVLHFQPIYSLPEIELNGVEALIRWNNPEEGLILPSKFINVLEEHGLIREVGRWVIEETFKISKDWKKYDVFINVNISPKQFEDRNFAKDIIDIARLTNADTTKIVLEITETSLMKNPEESIKILKKLKSEGFLIAVDDFGTGYSSLSYLKQFPIDVIKIDMSFIKNISKSHIDREIVLTIIRLSKLLGLKSLAEGIETRNQLNVLIDMGCELAQGYLFGKPMEREEIEQLIRSKKGL